MQCATRNLLYQEFWDSASSISGRLQGQWLTRPGIRARILSGAPSGTLQLPVLAWPMGDPLLTRLTAVRYLTSFLEEAGCGWICGTCGLGISSVQLGHRIFSVGIGE